MLGYLLDLLACLGHLGVAILVLRRPGRDALALIIGLLSIDLFGWNFATFAFKASHSIEWHWLDLSLSPFTTTLSLHGILIFVGRIRRYLAVLLLAYGTSAALAAGSALAFVSPAARLWLDSTSCPTVMLGTLLATMIFGHGLLIRHLCISHDDERARTIVMLAATVIGTVAGVTEFIDNLGVATPSLGNVGTLVSTSLIAVMVVRMNGLGRPVSVGAALSAVGCSVLALGGYVAVFGLADRQVALSVVLTATLTLAATAVVRRVLAAQAENGMRMQTLAMHGRLSSQMAHDLKNPLSALKGGVQFLQQEVAAQRSLERQGRILGLVVQQVERVDQVVTQYQRLARVQPEPSDTDVNALVRDVLALQKFAATNVAIRSALDPGVPRCHLDRDLLAGAVENLVRNALEAMPEGGELVVSTAAEKSSGRAVVQISVQDNGCGMDVRALEHAFDEFFTTKETGSGLGLSFVRRVVQAHDGEVKLRSSPGRGTTVTFRLPVVHM